MALVNYANNNAYDYSGQYYTGYSENRDYPYQLNSYDSYFEAMQSTILEDADKLYERLLNEQVNTTVANYANRNPSLLPTTPTANS
jgi:hypothetical protein